jgi:hypothetical protein
MKTCFCALGILKLFFYFYLFIFICSPVTVWAGVSAGWCFCWFWFQVAQELIYYVHDGSEEFLDSLTILANSSELGKQSPPQTLFVTVESVNDEAPVVTANNILQVRAPWF